MRKGRNRYIERIIRIVGESDPVRAIELFVLPHRGRELSLEAIARELGVREIIRQELSFEGGIFETSREGSTDLIIKLNSFSPVVRQRFTLAHEIAHLLLCSSLGLERACTEDRAQEDACDAIAAEFLMPVQEVVRFMGQQR